MIDTLVVIGGAVLAVIAAWWAGQRKGRKTERKATSDELSEAYNDATKEVRHAQSNVPDSPDDVIERLREVAKRGQGRRNP